MIHLKRSFTIALVLLFATINLSLAEDAPMEKVSKLPFGGWYEKVDYDVNPSIKGYTLPLKADQLRPFENDLTFVRSSSSDIALQSYGFMVSEGYRSDNLSHYYKGLRDNKVPMFVTTDTVQHMYHVLFDKSLADLEEKVFYDDLLVILDELLDDMGGYKCGPMPDAMPKKLPKDAVLSDYAVATAEKFLKVSIALLKEDHGYSDPDVLAELKNISAHAGFSPSPVFGYDEDYSQYIPLRPLHQDRQAQAIFQVHDVARSPDLPRKGQTLRRR
ncbi:MAG: DUF3160 domain-containing protein [Planctomycetota bacterium]|nr:DUF3160 domain-containing protein [Planctomycetota bacterium]